MSKYLKTAAAALALVALAAPAMADSKISGYFRTQFVADNFNGPPFTTTFTDMTSGNKRTASQIDNRFRLMYQNNLNEYVNFVYFGEVDVPWGSGTSTKYPGGQGGADSADGVNVETKNVYLDFKIPDSIVSTRVGIQGVSMGPDGILLGDDMAALRVNLQLSPMADVTAVYSKWRENDITDWDDVDFYGATLNLKPSDALKLNLDLAYLDQNSLKAQVGPFDSTVFGLIRDDFVAGGLSAAAAATAAGEASSEIIAGGLGAEAKLGAAKLTGYVAHTNGTVEVPGFTDTDLAGTMATAKVSAKLGMADTGLRLTWYSADDDPNDNEFNGFIGDLSGGVYEFAGENLSIFFADALYNNTNGGRRALIDAAYQGHGLIAVNGTANMNFTKTVYGKFGAGYFAAIEDKANEIGSAKQDTDLGFEVAARVGTKIAEKVDISLGGAYAVLGDFYKASATAADPDNVYKASVALNVPF